MKRFQWDPIKDIQNQLKHRVSFKEAAQAFNGTKRVILKDIDHSTKEEKRYFCLGKVKDRVLTVRFTHRGREIRIFGAGFWRKEQKIYEKTNKKKS